MHSIVVVIVLALLAVAWICLTVIGGWPGALACALFGICACVVAWCHIRRRQGVTS